MKETGIVRRLDDPGRITLPKEIRTVLEIGNKGELEIYIEGDRIVLEKYNSQSLPEQISRLETAVEEEGDRLGRERTARMKHYLEELSKLAN